MDEKNSTPHVAVNCKYNLSFLIFFFLLEKDSCEKNEAIRTDRSSTRTFEPLKLFMTNLQGEFCFAVFPTFLYFLAYISSKTDAI